MLVQGDEYILNGAKTYITNGVEADVFCVYAKVSLSLFLIAFSVASSPLISPLSLLCLTHPLMFLGLNAIHLCMSR